MPVILGLSPITLVAIVAVVVFLLYQLLYGLPGSERRRITDMNNKLPGPPALPLLGNAHQCSEKEGCLGHCAGSRALYRGHGIQIGPLDDAGRIKLLRSWVPQYKHLFRIWLGPLPSVAVYSPTAVREVLHSSKHLSKGISYQFLHEWLGLGLLTSTGDKWRSRRRMITPSFHFEILRGFVETFAEQAEIMVNLLKKEADKDQYVDLFPYITRAALDIICDSAMGTTVHAQGSEYNPYVEAVYEVSRSLFNRTLQPWNWNHFLYTTFNPTGRSYARKLKVLHDFTRDVIKTRRQILSVRYGTETPDAHPSQSASSSSKKKPFLDMLLEATDEEGRPLTDADIQEEVDTFMFEGHDTTSAGVAWTLFMVSQHLGVQRKMQEEIDRVLGDKLLPSFEDLGELHYVEMVIKEALRMFPSVPLIARVLDEDVVIDGMVLPKGIQVGVLIVATHLDPRSWGEDSDQFKPERFSKENMEGRDPFSYVPFSAGPRNCIGQKFALMEEKMLVTAVLRRFTITKDPNYEVEPHGELILRPGNGVRAKLTTRPLDGSADTNPIHHDKPVHGVALF